MSAKEPGGSIVSFLMGKCLAWGRGGYFSSSFKMVPTENGLFCCILAHEVMVASLRFILVQEEVSPNRRRLLVKLAMIICNVTHRSF